MARTPESSTPERSPAFIVDELNQVAEPRFCGALIGGWHGSLWMFSQKGSVESSAGFQLLQMSLAFTGRIAEGKVATDLIMSGSQRLNVFCTKHTGS